MALILFLFYFFASALLFFVFFSLFFRSLSLLHPPVRGWIIGMKEDEAVSVETKRPWHVLPNQRPVICQVVSNQEIYFSYSDPTTKNSLSGTLSTYTMHLMYTQGTDGKRIYTLKKITADGKRTMSAHPARFSPDDKFSRSVKRFYPFDLISMMRHCEAFLPHMRTQAKKKYIQLFLLMITSTRLHIFFLNPEHWC